MYVCMYKTKVPNLMVGDDHEFRDDFGDKDDDSNPHSREYQIGLCALQVYHEYQTQVRHVCE